MAGARQLSISVVIPAFNAERFIAEAVRSSREQDYAPREVIVADDASSDRTVEIAEGIEGVQVVRLPRNCGPAAARNAAVAAAGGELIAFLDADDMMLPGRLTRQAAAILGSPLNGLVFATAEYRKEGVDTFPEWFTAPAIDGRAVLGEPETGPVWEPMAGLARREVFDEIGWFDEGMRYSEDMDWVLRVFESRFEVVMLDEVLGVRRFHTGNATHDIDRMRSGIAQLMKRRIDRKRARAGA